MESTDNRVPTLEELGFKPQGLGNVGVGGETEYRTGAGWTVGRGGWWCGAQQYAVTNKDGSASTAATGSAADLESMANDATDDTAASGETIWAAAKTAGGLYCTGICVEGNTVSTTAGGVSV